MSPNEHTVVVIPTYNEADNIVAVLRQVQRYAPRAHVLVVDDQSPDGTAALVLLYARDNHDVFLLSREEKQGLGAAYRTGFGWAAARDYDVVVQIDADLSHPPAMIPRLVAALETADVAVGSRYVPGGSVRNWKLSRRAISRAGNAYVSLVLGIPVRDATSGFKAFRIRSLLEIGVLHSASNGYCFQIENTWRAHRQGLMIVELPITFVDRQQGASKMSGAIALEALLRVLGWRWFELTQGPGKTRLSPQRAQAAARVDHVGT